MEFDVWSQSFVAAMTTLWSKVASFIPDLIAALIIVLLGLVVAKVVDAVLSKGLAKVGLDRLMSGTGVNKMLARVGINSSVSAIDCGVVTGKRDITAGLASDNGCLSAAPRIVGDSYGNSLRLKKTETFRRQV